MKTPAEIVVLCGGLGGARTALGFVEAGWDSRCTFITNICDDIEVDGLLVCPDTDAVTYALAGLFDFERGWGIAGDTFDQPSGTHPWFGIGAQDRSWQRRRRRLLGLGRPLHEAVGSCATQMGVRARVLPASSEPVRTWILVQQKRLGFQEWLVRDGAPPALDRVGYDGIESALPSPGVIEALRAARLIVIAPSSPVASIIPIVSLPGISETLGARRDSVIAVSPIASRLPLLSDRDLHHAHAREVLMRAVGMPVDPPAIARRYRDIAATFVLDPADRSDEEAIRAAGIDVIVAPTVGTTVGARADLLRALAVTAERPGSPAQSTDARPGRKTPL